jgi:hypothetical protein
MDSASGARPPPPNCSPCPLLRRRAAPAAAETLIRYANGSLPRAVLVVERAGLASTLGGLGGGTYCALALGKENPARHPAGAAARISARATPQCASASLPPWRDRSRAFVEVGTRGTCHSAFAQRGMEGHASIEALSDRPRQVSVLIESAPRTGAWRRCAGAHLSRPARAHSPVPLNRRPNDEITSETRKARSTRQAPQVAGYLGVKIHSSRGRDCAAATTLHRQARRCSTVDGETSGSEDGDAGRQRVQNRLTTTCRALLREAREARHLRRAVTATTVARGLDAGAQRGVQHRCGFLYAAVPTGAGKSRQSSPRRACSQAPRLLLARPSTLRRRLRRWDLPHLPDGRCSRGSHWRPIVSRPTSQRVEADRHRQLSSRASGQIRDAASLPPARRAGTRRSRAQRPLIGDPRPEIPRGTIRRFG